MGWPTSIMKVTDLIVLFHLICFYVRRVSLIHFIAKLTMEKNFRNGCFSVFSELKFGKSVFFARFW